MDFKFTQNLPTKINSGQLQASLETLIEPGEKIAFSATFSAQRVPIEIIVHAPDSVERADAAAIIEAHQPQNDDTDEINDRQDTDLDNRIKRTPTITDILSRLQTLEGR